MVKKKKYHNIRDSKGRFVKKRRAMVPVEVYIKPAYELTIHHEKTIVSKEELDGPDHKTNLPGIDNDQVIPSYPNLIKENSSRLQQFDKDGKDIETGKPFPGGLPPHSIINKTKSPLIWYSLGVLTGLIAWLVIEYFFHLFNPMP